MTSVLNLKFKSYEYIIIDGGSNDGTVSKILKFKKKIDYISSKRDRGLYYAMNKGAKLANGEIIVFVNSGDILTKKSLFYVKKKFIENTKLSFVFGTVKRHYTKDIIIKYKYNPERLKYNFDFATSHSTGFFIKKKIFKKLNYFNVKYKCSADYDLYYRLILGLKKTGASLKKKELVGIVKSGGFSSKVNFLNHALEEFKIRYNNKQNLLFIILILINALFKHFLKKLNHFFKQINLSLH